MIEHVHFFLQQSEQDFFASISFFGVAAPRFLQECLHELHMTHIPYAVIANNSKNFTALCFQHTKMILVNPPIPDKFFHAAGADPLQLHILCRICRHICLLHRILPDIIFQKIIDRWVAYANTLSAVLFYHLHHGICQPSQRFLIQVSGGIHPFQVGKTL